MVRGNGVEQAGESAGGPEEEYEVSIARTSWPYSLKCDLHGGFLGYCKVHGKADANEQEGREEQPAVPRYN